MDTSGLYQFNAKYKYLLFLTHHTLIPNDIFQSFISLANPNPNNPPVVKKKNLSTEAVAKRLASLRDQDQIVLKVFKIIFINDMLLLSLLSVNKTKHVLLLSIIGFGLPRKGIEGERVGGTCCSHDLAL